MRRLNVSDLTGRALDWAVTVIEMNRSDFHAKAWWREAVTQGKHADPYSIDWLLAGPIIEREWLNITPWPNEADEDLRWMCEQHDRPGVSRYYFGCTPLIAAMRCYVAATLGDTIDLPEELT